MSSRSPSAAAKRDLVVAGGMVLAIYLISRYFDAFETLYTSTRRFESHEIDEIVLTALCFPFIAIWFSYRRWRDARDEYKQLLHSERTIRELEKVTSREERLKSLGKIASGIAHEFNNVLLPVRMLAEQTLDEQPPNSLGQTNLQKIIEECRRAQAIVANIQTFSWQQDADFQRIDFGLVVADALDLARISLPGTIRLKTRVKRDETYPILADPTQIYQIVINLINNAVDAIAGNAGEIEVSVECVSGGVGNTNREHCDPDDVNKIILRVTDNGCGMDPATREQALDPFFTTKGRGKGSGMGLSVVHGIVTSLGGSIELESTPETGTEIVICLPRQSADSSQAQTLSMTDGADDVPSSTLVEP